jgi:hypothetical protein
MITFDVFALPYRRYVASVLNGSGFTQEYEADVQASPNAPTVTLCQPGCDLRVRVGWSAVDNATVYRILRDGSQLNSVAAPILKYIDRGGLRAATTYEYTVTAWIGEVEGDPGSASIRVRGFTEDTPVQTTFREDAPVVTTFTEDAAVVTTFTEDGCGCH